MAPDDDLRSALAACACPTPPDEVLTAPRCAVLHCIGESSSLIEVRPESPWIGCKHLVAFGHGHFCTCTQRILLFKRYAL